MSLKKFLIVCCAIVLMAAMPVNSGSNFPTNGPCTPVPSSAGICSDNGVMAVYDASGNLVHIPVPGPQGVPGTDGKDGQDGKDGGPGPQGPPGQSMPQSFTLTCQASNGSVPKGFTAKCSWQ